MSERCSREALEENQRLHTEKDQLTSEKQQLSDENQRLRQILLEHGIETQ